MNSGKLYLAERRFRRPLFIAGSTFTNFWRCPFLEQHQQKIEKTFSGVLSHTGSGCEWKQKNPSQCPSGEKKHGIYECHQLPACKPWVGENPSEPGKNRTWCCDMSFTQRAQGYLLLSLPSHQRHHTDTRGTITVSHITKHQICGWNANFPQLRKTWKLIDLQSKP